MGNREIIVLETSRGERHEREHQKSKRKQIGREHKEIGEREGNDVISHGRKDGKIQAIPM